MTCPTCRTENPEGARFCQTCGSRLGTACPRCGTELPAGARFCHNCGAAVVAAGAAAAPAPPRAQMPEELAAKLEAARAGRAMAGERRVVTILFCDVQGSTALAGGLDPEEWTEVMNGAFEHLMAPVFRYEGTLARLLGDAILAFFGAPIAHEDDPQRAILAGLEILERIGAYREQARRRLGHDFNVRVGINTGLVVVGEVGSDLRVEYTAMGDAVNLAARMEQTAAPGTLQITGQTQRLVANLFAFEPLGGIAVKGKAEPVEAFRVLRALPGAAPVRGIEGLHSPLVGRDRELRALEEAAAALATGGGRIVSVIGEAGLGKSRLVAELRQIVDAEALTPRPPLPSMGEGESRSDAAPLPAAPVVEDLSEGDSPSPIDGRGGRGVRARWYEGRSFSYETAVPYAPFRSLWGRAFDLAGVAEGRARYAWLRARVGEVLPERADEVAPLFAAMLGVEAPEVEAEALRELEPSALRERIFGATRDFLAALAQAPEGGGLILVFEDLHWADASSLELIAHLMPLADTAPVVLIALFRPQRDEPSWRFHELAAREYADRYTPIFLEPLDEAQGRALVANLLHIEGLPEAIRTLILQKADGNPFYVEELVRSLLDAGVVVRENGHWRATRAVADIAVPDTLAGVITARLDRLDRDSRQVAQAAAVVGRAFARPIVAEVCAAEQALDGAVVERALTTLQRRELVREVRRLPEQVYHFKHVLTQETAYATALLSQRRALHARVAECLERLYGEGAEAHLADLAHHYYQAGAWERALAYSQRLGEEAQALDAPEAAIAHFTRALEAARRLDVTRVALLRARARACETIGDFARARADFEEALDAARAAGDRKAEWEILLDFGFLWMGRDHGEAGEFFRRALDLARGMDDPLVLAQSLNRFGNWHVTADLAREAVHYHEEALPIFRARDDRAGIAATLDLLSVASGCAGDPVRALDLYREAIRLYRELGDRRGLAGCLMMLPSIAGAYHWDTMVLPEATAEELMPAGDEALRITREIGWRAGEAFALGILSTVLGERGEFGRAFELAERALAVAEAIEHRPWMTAAYSWLGMLHFDLGAWPEAIAHLEKGLALAEGMGSLHWARCISGWLAGAHLAAGDPAAAERALEKVPATEVAVPSVAQRIGWWIRAELALAGGDAERALAILDELIASASNMAPGRVIPGLWLLRGEVLAALGRWDEAEATLREGEATADARGARVLLWRLRAALVGLYRGQGRVEEAEQTAASARAVIAEIAAEIPAAPLREQFRAAALARVDGTSGG